MQKRNISFSQKRNKRQGLPLKNNKVSPLKQKKSLQRYRITTQGRNDGDGGGEVPLKPICLHESKEDMNKIIPSSKYTNVYIKNNNDK